MQELTEKNVWLFSAGHWLSSPQIFSPDMFGAEHTGAYSLAASSPWLLSASVCSKSFTLSRK